MSALGIQYSAISTQFMYEYLQIYILYHIII